MKIGVITTQYASNYGALLQTYALQKYLNENLNQHSEVLAYYPSHYKEYWKILPRINGVKSVVLIVVLYYPMERNRNKKAIKKNETFGETDTL